MTGSRKAAFSVIITKYEEIVLMKKEYLYAGTSVLCFGTVATVSKLLMNQLDALYVLAFSFLFATLFLGVYNWKKGFLCEVKKLTARIWIRMILIGSLGVFFYNYFLLLGTARLKAQTAFVINELWPALIILFSCWILKEKMNLGNTAVIANLAYLTPFVSLILTHFVLGEKITVFSVLGLVLIVTGIIIQMIVNKKWRHQRYDIYGDV